MKKEFNINEYISLRLHNGKTRIYIKDELFIQCKYLLLSFPQESQTKNDEIDSIDDAAVKLDHTLEKDLIRNKIPPEMEFWAHCSNLQVWVENKYDTRLLHSNLAFPLLKKLTEVGSIEASRVFKEEIAMRFLNGGTSIKTFLVNEGYLDFLGPEEVDILIYQKENLLDIDPINPEGWKDLALLFNKAALYQKVINAYNRAIELNANDNETYFEMGKVFKKISDYDKSISSIKKALEINPKYLEIWKFLETSTNSYYLSLCFQYFSTELKSTLMKRLLNIHNQVPDESMTHLLTSELSKTDLSYVTYKGKITIVKENYLTIKDEDLQLISEIRNLSNLKDLKGLILHFNKIISLDGLQNLQNLEEIVLNSNQIEHTDFSLNQKNLIKLELKNNLITNLDFITNLTNLEYLNAPHNLITNIEGLRELTNLTQTILSHNQISNINPITSLKNLEVLDLSYNQLSTLNGLESLRNLRELYLRGNQISTLQGIEGINKLEILDISDTKITEIPESITKINTLKKVIIKNCLMTSIPKEISKIIVK
ncbi:MAG: hypothetical protein GF317_02895 [Candidatus Lokiarchaeota archaeon]|nr:hypothetical protein [Candidatus Lokiarchaeota archaeon]MBD3198854.1 hypothetical protein [Candidatus Lokiarchaeota archaeon]